MRTIVTLTLLMALPAIGPLSAQALETRPARTRKPVSKGYVGKPLPELRGHEGSDSRWLGKRAAVSLNKLRGKVVLVVLTSPA